MIKKPPPLNMGYNRNPRIEALKRKGVYQSGLYITSIGAQWCALENLGRRVGELAYGPGSKRPIIVECAKIGQRQFQFRF